MRILMGSDLFYPALPGGGERRLYEIAKRLAKKHEIHVLTRRLNGLPSREVHEGLHIHRISVPSGEIKLESFSDGLAFMGGVLRRGLQLGDFDVYAAEESIPIFSLGIIAKAKGKPLVATIHDVYRESLVREFGLKGGLMAMLEKAMFKLPYTKIITVSDSTKEKVIKSGAPAHAIEVIPNGVDLEKYDEVKTEKPDRPRVIYVGRLVWSKHIDDLLVAFSKLDLDAELYVVGEGPERGNLEILAKKLGVERRVTFTGFVREEEKIKLLKSASVLVLPSSLEGFGIVVVEAWASHIPALVSDIPALRALVEDGKTGLIFRLRDVGELKRKLERVLGEKKLCQKMAEEGYALVRERFTWDKSAEKVENVYQACANKME